MLKFFYNAAPNPMKIALLLEELELPYEPVPVDTRKGEQFEAHFLAVNPNAKVPAIVDAGVTVFDSNAILLFLADRARGYFRKRHRPSAGATRIAGHGTVLRFARFFGDQ